MSAKFFIRDFNFIFLNVFKKLIELLIFKYRIRYFLFFFNFLFILNCSTASEDRFERKFIDLSGDWIIEYVEYINSFENQKLNSGDRIHLPVDLKFIDSKFYGKIILTKQFELDSKDVGELIFIAGAIGSTDKVSINGKIIGSIGREYDIERISALWMLPRQYRIDLDHLNIGENTIKVEIRVFDEKAGVYMSPLALSDEITANDLLRWKYIFNVFLQFGIFGVCAFITIFIGLALIFQNLPKYYYLYIGATGFYLFFILHFLPVNIGLNYLLSIQLYFSGGLVTACLAVIFYLRIIKAEFNKFDLSLIFVGFLLVPVHFLKNDFYYIYSVSEWINIYATFIIGTISWFSYLGLDNRYGTYKYSKIIFLPSLVAFLASLWDLLVRMRLLNMPFVFNYFSMVYSVLIFIIHTQEVIDSRKKISEVKEKQLEERLNIARDIHDIIGTELTGMLHLVSIPEGKSKLFVDFDQRIKMILENIKEFIGVLNGDHSVSFNLDTKIINYIQKLKNLPNLHITSDIQSLQSKIKFRELNEIYKIFLESVSNILKHSNADKINVVLKTKKNKIIFAISDNGNGKILKPSHVNSDIVFLNSNTQKGNGLKNILYRSKSIGAKLRIRSKIGKGSLIYLSKDI